MDSNAPLKTIDLIDFYCTGAELHGTYSKVVDQQHHTNSHNVEPWFLIESFDESETSLGMELIRLQSVTLLKLYRKIPVATEGR